MNDEFLGTVTNEGEYKSDYWLFDDEYIKEERYESGSPKVFIYKIEKFIEEHSDKKRIVERVKEIKGIV